MGAMINSFVLVFVSEMGDKTQLLAFVLASRFMNRPNGSIRYSPPARVLLRVEVSSSSL
jgi:hypothetical protein